GDGPFDVLYLVELVGLSVALVIVVLAHADDDQHRCDAHPLVVASKRGADLKDLRDLAASRRLGDDEQTLALAEAGARCAAHGSDDALDRGAIDQVGLVRPDHPATLEDLPQLPRASIRSRSV